MIVFGIWLALDWNCVFGIGIDVLIYNFTTLFSLLELIAPIVFVDFYKTWIRQSKINNANPNASQQNKLKNQVFMKSISILVHLKQQNDKARIEIDEIQWTLFSPDFISSDFCQASCFDLFRFLVEMRLRSFGEISLQIFFS